MRAAFGLVALLVAAGILIYIWTEHTTAVVQKSKPAEDKIKPMTVNPIPAPTADPADQTKQVDLQGDARGLVVKSIGTDNPMALHWRLQQGDRIIQAGDIVLKDYSEGDRKIYLHQAYTYQRDLIVERQNHRLQLPFNP